MINPKAYESDSQVQRHAEKVVLELLSQKYGFVFSDETVLKKKLGFEPDAIDSENKVVVEVFARVGQLKAGQKRKVNADVLKLAFFSRVMGDKWRLIMCFTSTEAASHLLGSTWAAKAASEFGIEVLVVELDPILRQQLIETQKTQYR